MAPKHRHICPDALDDAAIGKLAERLPKGADRKKFSEGLIRARDALKEAVERPDLNARFREVKALYQAARRSDYEAVANRIEDLSPIVRELLTGLRGQRPIPSPAALRDPRRGDKACSRVKLLCTPGGGNRPIGNRSRTEPLLAGPRLWIENKDQTYSVRQMQQRPERQHAERVFLTWLRLAWWDATGKPPPSTVNPHRPGTFASIVVDCLEIVSPSTNAIKLIQRYARERQCEEAERIKRDPDLDDP